MSATERESKRLARQALDGYLTCAFWASTDDDGEPLDRNYGPGDLAAEALGSLAGDLSDFLSLLVRERIDWSEVMDPGRLGHDFWLTRNRHGAGFWDRGYGELGDRLTALSHPYGESILYVGDDGKVWVS